MEAGGNDSRCSKPFHRLLVHGGSSPGVRVVLAAPEQQNAGFPGGRTARQDPGFLLQQSPILQVWKGFLFFYFFSFLLFPSFFSSFHLLSLIFFPFPAFLFSYQPYYSTTCLQ